MLTGYLWENLLATLQVHTLKNRKLKWIDNYDWNCMNVYEIAN